MTRDEKNIAIARHMGTSGWDMVPDYFTDLNAMHNAEKSLFNEQRRVYASILAEEEVGRYIESSPLEYFNDIHMAASERAEAFGKAASLW